MPIDLCDAEAYLYVGSPKFYVLSLLRRVALVHVTQTAWMVGCSDRSFNERRNNGAWYDSDSGHSHLANASSTQVLLLTNPWPLTRCYITVIDLRLLCRRLLVLNRSMDVNKCAKLSLEGDTRLSFDLASVQRCTQVLEMTCSAQARHVSYPYQDRLHPKFNNEVDLPAHPEYCSYGFINQAQDGRYCLKVQQVIYNTCQPKSQPTMSCWRYITG